MDTYKAANLLGERVVRILSGENLLFDILVTHPPETPIRHYLDVGTHSECNGSVVLYLMPTSNIARLHCRNCGTARSTFIDKKNTLGELLIGLDKKPSGLRQQDLNNMVFGPDRSTNLKKLQENLAEKSTELREHIHGPGWSQKETIAPDGGRLVTISNGPMNDDDFEGVELVPVNSDTITKNNSSPNPDSEQILLKSRKDKEGLEFKKIDWPNEMNSNP